MLNNQMQFKSHFTTLPPVQIVTTNWNIPQWNEPLSLSESRMSKMYIYTYMYT